MVVPERIEFSLPELWLQLLEKCKKMCKKWLHFEAGGSDVNVLFREQFAPEKMPF